MATDDDHHVNPAVAAAMAEVDVDISKEFPKPPASEAVKLADVAIVGVVLDVSI